MPDELLQRLIDESNADIERRVQDVKTNTWKDNVFSSRIETVEHQDSATRPHTRSPHQPRHH